MSVKQSHLHIARKMAGSEKTICLLSKIFLKLRFLLLQFLHKLENNRNSDNER